MFSPLSFFTTSFSTKESVRCQHMGSFMNSTMAYKGREWNQVKILVMIRKDGGGVSLGIAYLKRRKGLSQWIWGCFCPQRVTVACNSHVGPYLMNLNWRGASSPRGMSQKIMSQWIKGKIMICNAIHMYVFQHCFCKKDTLDSGFIAWFQAQTLKRICSRCYHNTYSNVIWWQFEHWLTRHTSVMCDSWMDTTFGKMLNH